LFSTLGTFSGGEFELKQPTPQELDLFGNQFSQLDLSPLLECKSFKKLRLNNNNNNNPLDSSTKQQIKKLSSVGIEVNY
jgi:hypothetical protein